MLGHSIARLKPASRFAVPDQPVIIHAFSSEERSNAGVTEQLHVRPQRTTKKSVPADLYGIVFEDVNIRAFDVPFELIDLPRELFPVKLVVAQNVENGNLKFLVKYPLKPPVLDMDVAGQHNNVGVDNWWHEIAELNMQITHDTYLQKKPPPVGTKVSGWAGPHSIIYSRYRPIQSPFHSETVVLWFQVVQNQASFIHRCSYQTALHLAGRLSH